MDVNHVHQKVFLWDYVHLAMKAFIQYITILQTRIITSNVIKIPKDII